MTIQKIKDNYSHGLFATHPTTGHALRYAYELVETLAPAERIAMYTAIHVVLNSALDEVLSLALKEM